MFHPSSSIWRSSQSSLSFITLTIRRLPSIIFWSTKQTTVASNSLRLMDCSPPGSSVHGIFQARILERVAMSLSRESSWPRDWTRVSSISCTGRRVLCHEGPPGSWSAVFSGRDSGHTFLRGEGRYYRSDTIIFPFYLSKWLDYSYLITPVK